MQNRANPLLAVFPELREARYGGSGYDWRGAGVDSVYVIYIAGRCGSTLLTHYLEDSRICGRPHEFFN